ncbi:MAG: hypothetical protein ABW184_17175 [Sphingobium sp.]
MVAPQGQAIAFAPGVTLRQIQPGGKRGPNDEVLADVMGGQVWTDMFLLGGEDDGIPLCVPDIRLPANQYWPLHWHDCWIAVVILDGDCRIGDWHMTVGDVLISEDALEYGPLVIGPQGCQMFEIFARLHPDEGGYATEYRDHPTLDGTTRSFAERSARNAGNAGRQVVPVDGTPGLSKGRLAPGAQWDLGPATDPARAIMASTFLSPGETIAAHRYDDWHGVFVLDGSLTVEGQAIGRNDVLTIQPGSGLGRIEAGAQGAQLLEVSRIAAGMARHFR